MNGFIRFQQSSDLQLFLHLLTTQFKSTDGRFVCAKREPMIIFEAVPQERMDDLNKLAEKHEAEINLSEQYSPL
jgi:hypothetical protein